MAYLTFGLALVSLVLHFIAPRTATKLDDDAAEVVDEIAAQLPKATVVDKTK